MFQALKHKFHVLELVFHDLEYKLLLGEKTFCPRQRNIFVVEERTFCSKGRYVLSYLEEIILGR